MPLVSLAKNWLYLITNDWKHSPCERLSFDSHAKLIINDDINRHRDAAVSIRNKRSIFHLREWTRKSNADAPLRNNLPLDTDDRRKLNRMPCSSRLCGRTQCWCMHVCVCVSLSSSFHCARRVHTAATVCVRMRATERRLLWFQTNARPTDVCMYGCACGCWWFGAHSYGRVSFLAGILESRTDFQQERLTCFAACIEWNERYEKPYYLVWRVKTQTRSRQSSGLTKS